MLASTCLVLLSEAMPLAKSSTEMLDYCVKRAIVKIFKVSDSDNIYVTKQTCGFATT